MIRYLIDRNEDMADQPQIINEVFSKEDYEFLRNYLFDLEKRPEWFSDGFGRYHYADSVINEYAEKIVPLARKIFNSETLLVSYALFSQYEGPNAKLLKHRDDNACTYTIDMCVYQTEPWDLWVDGKPYTLMPNQGLAFRGEELEHWREQFPNPDSQQVAMIFFHFVEPEHWFFTKGPSYLEVIRGNVTEEEWAKSL